MEEDPTITFGTNKETKEQILTGLGEQHIDVIVAKLKAKFGVDVKLAPPKVAYREAIKKRLRYRDVIRSSPAVTDSLVMYGFVLSPATARDLNSVKRYSAALFRRISSRQLKRVFRILSRRVFLQDIRW